MTNDLYNFKLTINYTFLEILSGYLLLFNELALYLETINQKFCQWGFILSVLGVKMFTQYSMKNDI
jgi:hypothetical protein